MLIWMPSGWLDEGDKPVSATDGTITNESATLLDMSERIQNHHRVVSATQLFKQYERTPTECDDRATTTAHCSAGYCGRSARGPRGATCRASSASGRPRTSAIGCGATRVYGTVSSRP